MNIGTIEVRGYELVVEVSARQGMFSLAQADGRRLAYAETLEAAKQQAAAKLAKAKIRVAVEFVSRDGERGVATGIHAGHSGIMARVDGTSVVLSDYKQTTPLRPDIPPEEIARLLSLRDQQRNAKKDADAIEAQYQFDLRKAVEAAIGEAQGVSDAQR